MVSSYGYGLKEEPINDGDMRPISMNDLKRSICRLVSKVPQGVYME